MPVIDISKDLDALTLTITAQFAAPVQRVWEVYADPRQLERVWGPPTYPATFVQHELAAGGRTEYYMTSPEGEKFAGVWEVTEVHRPDHFAFVDYFADGDFTVNLDLPVSTCTYTFEAADGGTRATYVSAYQSVEAIERVLAMGMEEGATLAINQIDELVTA
jgi:uncharacterized protein YndB with AHSA1/START domain